MKVHCAHCAKEHDLEAMDPAFGLPDEVFALSPAERNRRARWSKDFCDLVSLDGRNYKSYLRALLQVNVEGRLQPCRWGIWVEALGPDFNSVLGLWHDDRRLSAGPWSVTLANRIAGFPNTLGLPGTLRFINLTDVTYLTLDEGDHPLIADQRQGVSAARSVEWLLSMVHPPVDSLHEERSS